MFFYLCLVVVIWGTKSISTMGSAFNGPKPAFRLVAKKHSMCLAPFGFITRRCNVLERDLAHCVQYSWYLYAVLIWY